MCLGQLGPVSLTCGNWRSLPDKPVPLSACLALQAGPVVCCRYSALLCCITLFASDSRAGQDGRGRRSNTENLQQNKFQSDHLTTSYLLYYGGLARRKPRHDNQKSVWWSATALLSLQSGGLLVEEQHVGSQSSSCLASSRVRTAWDGDTVIQHWTFVSFLQRGSLALYRSDVSTLLSRQPYNCSYF